MSMADRRSFPLPYYDPQPVSEPQRLLTASRIVEICYVLFLILIIIGNDPFAPRTPEALKAVSEAAGEGNVLRQLQFFVLFAITMAICVPALKFEIFSGIAFPHVLSIIWCVLSILWAIDPGITARRAVLLLVVVGTMAAAVRYMGLEKSIRLLYWVLAGTVIVCWVSLPLTPNAVHPPTEEDKALVGNWRGLFFQKNLAGAVMGLASILFLHVAVTRQRKMDILLFLLAFGFLIGTRSKTSLALFLVAAGISMSYRLAWRSELGRYIFNSGLLFLLFAGALLAWVQWDVIVRVFSDPTSFTGRVAIWQTALSYVAENPIFGAGYSSFWQIGYESPVFRHMTEDFLKTVAHSHSGYIEILVTTGMVGLFFAILGFFVWPLQLFLSKDRSSVALKAALFGIWIFVILHNFMETTFFARDKQVWVIFVVAITVMQLNRNRKLRI